MPRRHELSLDEWRKERSTGRQSRQKSPPKQPDEKVEDVSKGYNWKVIVIVAVVVIIIFLSVCYYWYSGGKDDVCEDKEKSVHHRRNKKRSYAKGLCDDQNELSRASLIQFGGDGAYTFDAES